MLPRPLVPLLAAFFLLGAGCLDAEVSGGDEPSPGEGFVYEWSASELGTWTILDLYVRSPTKGMDVSSTTSGLFPPGASEEMPLVCNVVGYASEGWRNTRFISSVPQGAPLDWAATSPTLSVRTGDVDTTMHLEATRTNFQAHVSSLHMPDREGGPFRFITGSFQSGVQDFQSRWKAEVSHVDEIASGTYQCGVAPQGFEGGTVVQGWPTMMQDLVLPLSSPAGSVLVLQGRADAALALELVGPDGVALWSNEGLEVAEQVCLPPGDWRLRLAQMEGYDPRSTTLAWAHLMVPQEHHDGLGCSQTLVG